jgi:hypothetical protein
MKTKNCITRILRGSNLALTVAALAAATMVSQANPQYKPTGDDGITASPKLRAQLDERKARLNTAPVMLPTMACAKCQDVWASVPVKGAKGGQILVAGGAPTQKIARHLCTGCETTITVVGHGKGTHDVATHKCASCGSQNLACCGTTTGAVATKGMEKNPLELAPVK